MKGDDFVKKKQLKKLLKQTQKVLESVTPPTVTKDERKLNDWLTVYDKIQSEKGYHPHTLSNRRATLNHVRRIWGDQAISELKPHGVSAGLAQFLPQKTSTAGRVLSELREVLRKR